MIKVLDLFSGAGAYSLGLERAGGFQTVAFCEILKYPRDRLKEHWPDAAIYEDVVSLTGERLRADGHVPEWIVAGWPCQGNSPAGTGLGMDDPRSGLWSHISRLAGELRPLGLLLENSVGLLTVNGGNDFGRVLGDLAALGYDAEWHCLSAAAYDAPHIRDRVWIIATLADADVFRQPGPRQSGNAGNRASDSQGQATWTEHGGEDVADAQSIRRHPCGTQPARKPGRPIFDSLGYPLAFADSFAPVGTAIARQERHTWEPEPDVGRVATGVADRVDRIHALGNLNPPIIPERIGRAIMSAYPGLFDV